MNGLNHHTITGSKLAAIADLIRLQKQYGTALLLLPTLWSLFIVSGGRPEPQHLVIFILGSFLMRSAGCVVNDIADRRFDSQVARTRTRPLADGRLTVGEAVVVFTVLSLLAFGLVLMLNAFTIALSVVALLLASVYPLVKRVSFFPQVFLGMAFGWGAVMAWASVEGTVDVAPLLIFMANIMWSVAYDTMYALMDVEDDRRVGVKSTAIFFGRSVHLAVAVAYLVMFGFLYALGYTAGLGIIYHAGTTVALLFSLFIVWRVRKKGGSPEAAFRGFLDNLWVGALILLSIVADLNLL